MYPVYAIDGVKYFHCAPAITMASRDVVEGDRAVIIEEDEIVKIAKVTWCQVTGKNWMSALINKLTRGNIAGI